MFGACPLICWSKIITENIITWMKISIDRCKEKTLPTTVGSCAGLCRRFPTIGIDYCFRCCAKPESYNLFPPVSSFSRYNGSLWRLKKIALHNNGIHCHHCFLKVHARWIVIFRESQCSMHQYASTDAGQPFKQSKTKSQWWFSKPRF